MPHELSAIILDLLIAIRVVLQMDRHREPRHRALIWTTAVDRHEVMKTNLPFLQRERNFSEFSAFTFTLLLERSQVAAMEAAQ